MKQNLWILLLAVFAGPIACTHRAASVPPVDAAADRGAYELYDITRDHGILVHRLDPGERIDVQYLGHRPIAATIELTCAVSRTALR